MIIELVPHAGALKVFAASAEEVVRNSRENRSDRATQDSVRNLRRIDTGLHWRVYHNLCRAQRHDCMGILDNTRRSIMIVIERPGRMYSRGEGFISMFQSPGPDRVFIASGADR